jgi:hypothetical protein
MIDTDITMSDGTTKWGLVTVWNADETVDRQFRIDAAAMQAVREGNNVMPPGLTNQEFAEQRFMVAGRPCNPGEALARTDGSCIVNLGVEQRGKELHVRLVMLAAGEWEVVGGKLRVLEPVAFAMDIPKA